VGALCDGEFQRLSGEYGELRAAKFEQNEMFVVRRKELYGVAVKERKRNCAIGQLRVSCVERECWNVNLIENWLCRGRGLEYKLN